MASRADYRHFLPIATRWKDNDVYGHVNNVEYYSYFDTVINTYLIADAGLDIHHGTGRSACAPNRIASSSANSRSRRRSTPVFASSTSAIRACATASAFSGPIAPATRTAREGWFVHVFVDRETRAGDADPGADRAALQRLLVSRTGMKVRGAVLREMGRPAPYAQSRPLTIETLTLQPPGASTRLRVRVLAAGLCHSDLSVIDGSRPRPMPMLLGHEAVGEVVELGDDVREFSGRRSRRVLVRADVRTLRSVRHGPARCCANQVHRPTHAAICSAATFV